MKFSDKHQNAQENQLFGIDFHDFIQREREEAGSLELASEFGLTLGDIQKLKKNLKRR